LSSSKNLANWYSGVFTIETKGLEAYIYFSFDCAWFDLTHHFAY